MHEEKYIFINDDFILEKNAVISIQERSCRFGDGIIESCKIVNGIIYDYSAHKARIKRGLKAFEILAEIKNLEKNSYDLIQKNNIKNGNLKISISRGIGSKGYLPTHQSNPLITIEAIKEQEITKTKIRLGISKIKTPKLDKRFAGCKTMQSAHYVLAKIAAKKSKNFDDIMLNQNRQIAECSSANIFWIKNGKIFTPSKKCDIIFGTIRQKIIQKLPTKINLVEAFLPSILKADEIFITNANLLVLPIDEVVYNNEIISFKRNISEKILKLIEEDMLNYCQKIYAKN